MTKYFFGILIFLVSLSVVAEQYLVSKTSITSSVIDIDDSSDSSDEENDPLKGKKGNYEEDCFIRFTTSSTVCFSTSLKQYSTKELLFPSGHLQNPFLPPDLV